MRLVSLATAPGQQLDADAAASWDRVAREVQRRYGWLPVLTDSVRPYAVQVRIFLDRYDPQAAGSGYYGDVRWWEGRRYVRRRYRKSDGAPAAAAAPPGTSRHGFGLAVDCSGLGGFTGTRYRQLMSVQQDHGWSNAVGRSINEAWHQEYTRANDRHAGTGSGSGAALTPAPTTSEEDDMYWLRVNNGQGRGDVYEVTAFTVDKITLQEFEDIKGVIVPRMTDATEAAVTRLAGRKARLRKHIWGADKGGK